jgi:hypothetical protein
MQYGYFDGQAKEYIISRLELFKPNVKIFETMMPIKGRKWDVQQILGLSHS